MADFNPFASFQTDSAESKAAAAASSSSAAADGADGAAAAAPKAKGGQLVMSGPQDWDRIGRGAAYGDLLSAHRIRTLRPVVLVAAGCTSYMTAIVDDSGAVFTWGRNDAGQLGLGDLETRHEPTLVSGVNGNGAVVGAACGKGHTVLWTDQGTLLTCGRGTAGQLGNGKLADTTAFAAAESAPHVVKASCGMDMTTVISSDGGCYACGSPENGQLGNGTDGQYFVNGTKLSFHFEPTFSKVEGWHRKVTEAGASTTTQLADVRIADVACGASHTVALDTHGNVYTWGFGAYGRLGHSSPDTEMYPRLVNTFFPLQPHRALRAVTAGGSCTLFVTSGGHLFYCGKLPNASRGEASMYPVFVDDIANFPAVHVAASHTGVVMCAESVTVAWGKAEYGEFGYGDEEGQSKNSIKPAFVGPLDGCIMTGLACGRSHLAMIARDDDADDKAWLKDCPFADKFDTEAALAARPAPAAGGGGAKKKQKTK